MSSGRAVREVRIVDPVEHASWDALILNLPGATFFHSSIWARVLVEAYRYRPHYFALFEADRLLAALPVMEVDSFLTGRRGVSLPFSDYAGPVAANDADTDELIGRAVRHAVDSGWKYLEIRCGGSAPDALPSERYKGHTIELTPDTEMTAAGFSDANRRNIARAERLGVCVEISDSARAVREFYSLNLLTRKRHGLPPQPYRFFEAVLRHVISPGHGIVALASHDGRTVAGAVYFRFGDTAVFKYGASDKAFQHTRANNLVMWEAIRYYSLKGARSLCLGRTAPDNAGLARFKAGWGAREQEINYYRYDPNKGSFTGTPPTHAGLSSKVLSKTPAPLLKIIGSLLYRHVG